ncbi:hypothetical protein ACFFRR_000659 [Megaselia abdita]
MYWSCERSKDAKKRGDVFKEKTEDLLAKALKVALGGKDDSAELTSEKKTEETKDIEVTDGLKPLSQRSSSPQSSMMMSQQSTHSVVTDSDGLILPKKLMNPCMESKDRKDLHRELMFNNKVGKSVLNQKSELQRALEKQKERQFVQKQQEEDHKLTELGLKGELNRVIMERAQKLEKKCAPSAQEGELDRLNPEYLNARAKLRTRIDTN